MSKGFSQPYPQPALQARYLVAAPVIAAAVILSGRHVRVPSQPSEGRDSDAEIKRASREHGLEIISVTEGELLKYERKVGLYP